MKATFYCRNYSGRFLGKTNTYNMTNMRFDYTNATVYH